MTVSQATPAAKSVPGLCDACGGQSQRAALSENASDGAVRPPPSIVAGVN
jgi:hypothetical protein